MEIIYYPIGGEFLWVKLSFALSAGRSDSNGWNSSSLSSEKSISIQFDHVSIFNNNKNDIIRLDQINLTAI